MHPPDARGHRSPFPDGFAFLAFLSANAEVKCSVLEPKDALTFEEYYWIPRGPAAGLKDVLTFEEYYWIPRLLPA